jgi:hypothetical protein
LHDMSCLLSQAHGTQTQNIDRMQVATSITSPTFTTASTTATTQPYPVQQRTAITSNRSLQLSSAHETDTQQDPRAPLLISHKVHDLFPPAFFDGVRVSSLTFRQYTRP